jgi:asparagine synthase (glutamine-hydrolysing)
MCGIAGIISLEGEDAELIPDLIRLSRTLGHRGPDNEGFLIETEGHLRSLGSEVTPPNVFNAGYDYSPTGHINTVSGPARFGFAHRRLSILDLSNAGHQPLSYLNRYWINFNGEIYNYKEIRSELRSSGYTFLSETDTEVILASYDKWDKDCFNRFNGMWAMMIYDAHTGEFIASRDRTGVKPFYYIHDARHFCFASEQKALLTLPYLKAEVNASEVFDFFILNTFETKQESFFKGIKELKPGCYLTIDSSGKLSDGSYYSRPITSREQKFNESEATSEVYTTLKRSVELRLRSDVEVASCLSGGTDSSAIVSLMKELQPSKTIHVFTAAFPGTAFDESHYADEVTRHIKGISHKVTPTAKELIDDLSDLIYCQDIPVWSTSTYAQYRVMKLVHEAGIKVVLDGQGGDELFAGYSTYYYPYWKGLLLKGRFSQLLQEMKGFGPGAINLFLRLFAKEQLIPALLARLQLSTLFKLYPELNYLNNDLLSTYSDHLTESTVGSDLNDQLFNDYFGNRLKGYLKCEDRCAMNFSVESRVPFADDPDLAKLAFSLPGSCKINKGVNKYILKRSLRGHVPDLILNRTDKMGYVTPNNQWIAEIKDSVRDLFTADLDPYIDTKALLKNYDKLFTPAGNIDTGRIFKYISFAVWMKRFIR